MTNTAFRITLGAIFAAFTMPAVLAQLIDNNQAVNVAKAGINKSLADEIGPGRGDLMTPNSSLFIINRDPFRSVRRGRQLFQRKFTRAQGQGPANSDGTGNIMATPGIGAGLSDSCAGCHGRPRGSAGAGGDVATRPDSRDAPHLFGLGLKEMLADEITMDLRNIRARAMHEARTTKAAVTRPLISKGISFGSITANPDGTLDTSKVEGVNPDLRVRPFFAEGSTISIREFLVGAFRNEMGLEAADPDLLKASAGGRVVTPSGMVLDGSQDAIEAPPVSDPGADPDGDGVTNEVPTSLVDHMEFYLLHYFKPAVYKQSEATKKARKFSIRSAVHPAMSPTCSSNTTAALLTWIRSTIHSGAISTTCLQRQPRFCTKSATGPDSPPLKFPTAARSWSRTSIPTLSATTWARPSMNVTMTAR